MSINKQLYFGIFGIYFLFFALCLLLLFLSSLKLFFHYNDNVKAYYNEFDTNLVSLNSENADIFIQLFFYQANFETYFFRNYYNIINMTIGNDLLETINLTYDEMKDHFIFSADVNKSDDSSSFLNTNNNSFFVISNNTKLIESIEEMKKFYILIPTIEKSLDIYSYTKNNFKIFNRFNIYNRQINAYISYKYNEKDYQINLENFTLSSLTNNITQNIKNMASSIEELNEIQLSKLSYRELFDDNILNFLVSENFGFEIDPFNKKAEKNFHFCSIFFGIPVDHNDNLSNIIELDPNDIDNYISFDIELNYLSYLLMIYAKTNGNPIFILFNDLNFSASKSMCRFNDYINFTYSDNSIKENINLSIDYLKIKDTQEENLSQCLSNYEVQNIIESDLDQNYKLKILYDMFKYSDNRDINSNIKIKIIRELSPIKYITSFLNLKFYHSISYYIIIFKIFNNISNFINLTDRIIYRQVAYIMLFVFILWFCIFIIIFIKLYLTTDRISSPIRKLIKNISLTQSNFNKDEEKLQQIYYQEDKDINDLFQLCQKLIFGGLKKKVNIQKKRKLNVYNNISKVKTNNMIINENQIVIQRNQKYNEIFEKGEDKSNNNDTFKQEILYKYYSKDFDNKVKNYELKKSKKITLEQKEEFEKIKNKDNEYKMFYYIHKEVKGFMPYNNLFKFYYEKFSNKQNKKKKNN